MMKQRSKALLLILLLVCGTAACGGKEETGRKTGLFYEAAGISPDAVALTVDGREVPAWRYLYWLTYACDFIRDAYEETGETLDWSAPLSGGTLADYAKEQAIQSAALYATVENWGAAHGAALTEEDRTDLSAAWAEKEASYGGEAEYLAVLADMGLERADAEALSADYYLYRRLYGLFRTEGSSLYPGTAEVDAFAAERNYLCADFILVSTADVSAGDTEALVARRQRAENIFSQLNADTDPAAGFAALADTYSDDPERSQYPAGRTFAPGAGVMPAEAEAAVMALEEGQWSGLVESADGIYILLRRAPDREIILGDYFDSLLQTAANQAEIQMKEPFAALSPGEFYEKLTVARQAAETAGQDAAP